MKKKIALSNADLISLSRIPLAFAFIYFFDNVVMAPLILLTSWVSDIADGIVARKNGRSLYGSYIDAITDKFFFVIVVSFLLYSNAINFIQTGILLLRDAYVLLLSIFVYALSKKRKADYIRQKWDAKISGKVTTGLQFIAILAKMSPASEFEKIETLFYILFVSGIVTIADYSLVVFQKVSRKNIKKV